MDTREQSAINTDLTLDPTVTSNTETISDNAATQRQQLPADIDGIIVTLRSIAALEPDDISRDEVSKLKGHFYTLRKVDLDEALKAHIDAGNEPATFISLPDPREEELKTLIEQIRVKKAERALAIEAEQEANAVAKADIIDRLNAMAEDTDNVNRLFTEFRELQDRFKAIGDVPPTRTTELWKRYQEAVERFYDQLKINKDLRDYDFRKNLETKTLLCEEAERLDATDDIVSAFKRLQELHDKWRETGPVAKDVREEIWNRFKDASAVINKRYQQFFEERKARELENEAAKTALCERVEALDFSDIKTFNAWEEMTRHILAAQEEWKQLGYAPRRSNNTLFARFRETCDRFFTAKAEYYREVKENLANNLARKTALCERAESLMDSSDWKATTDIIVDLQKEWKTIGSVPKRHSDAIWKRFQTACDRFFERKKAETGDIRSREQTNLQAKRDIIDELRKLPEDIRRDDAVKAVRDAQARWQQVGHVPFREKDKVYAEFRAVIDAIFARFDAKERRDNVARFENSLNEADGSRNIMRERERLCRILEQQRSEIKTYENNLGFLSSKSKSGDSMVREIERRIERLRGELATTEEKIKLIDSKLN